MKVEKIMVGTLDENCYLLEKDGKCIVIDPGEDSDQIMKKLANFEVLAVFITHYHFDHIGGLSTIMNQYHPFLFDFYNTEEKEYTVGPFSFEVIHTPGHSLNSISFYFEKERAMFVGDFVFELSVGRCDLLSGSDEEMDKSIALLKQYPKDITLYPGHYNITTLESELLHNPYF